MGFPNVDTYLCRKFTDHFADTQNDPTETIDDLFEDMDEPERMEVSEYLQSTRFTRDTRDREKGRRVVYIVPHFPMTDIPFPQIGISLGTETVSDKFIGDYTGESIPVKDCQGNVVAFDIPKGYYATASWNIDVLCPTKDETVWISRFCQLFVCRLLEDLDAMGVQEVAVSLADINIQSEQFPHAVFCRRITISGKTANTWKKRIPSHTYKTGINKALNP